MGWQKMLDIFSWTQVKNKIYFKSYQMSPGTFCYDLNSEELVTLNNLNEPLDWIPAGYFRTSSIGNYIIFLPYFAQDFVVYNVENNAMKFVAKRDNRTLYRSTVIVDNQLYMFPNGECLLSEIAVFDASSETIYYPFEACTAEFQINSFGDAAIDGKIIYLPLKSNNEVLKLNIVNGNYEVKHVGEREDVYGIIFKKNEMFYLAGNNNFIYIWDGKEYWQEIPIENRERGKLIPWEQRFSDAVVYGNKILFAPLNYSCVIGMDIHDRSIDYVLDFGNTEIITWGMEKFRKGIFLSGRSIDGKGGNNYLILEENQDIYVEETDLFKISDKVDLCRYGIEYSEFALSLFIKHVIDNSI